MSKNWMVVSIIVFLLATAAVVASVWAVRYNTAGIRGRINAREQIQSAPSRIAAYNYFFDLCASIQGDEAALDAQTALLAGAQEAKERDRIRQNIAGISAQRQRDIFRYNADARKDYTVGQFRDSDLPYQLSVGDYTKDRRTSCGSR